MNFLEKNFYNSIRTSKNNDLKNFREFRSSYEAEERGEKNFSDLVSDEFKKSEEFKALFYYGGNMYRPINRFLRGYQEGRDELYTLIKLINNVVLHNSAPENIVVYRSTHIKAVKQLCEMSFLRKGAIFTDKAYFSTSLSAGCAIDYGKAHSMDCILRLYLPKETKGAYLSYKGTFSTLNEQEFLLAPNTKFEIIKVHYLTKPRLIECIAK